MSRLCLTGCVQVVSHWLCPGWVSLVVSRLGLTGCVQVVSHWLCPGCVSLVVSRLCLTGCVQVVSHWLCPGCVSLVVSRLCLTGCVQVVSHWLCPGCVSLVVSCCLQAVSSYLKCKQLLLFGFGHKDLSLTVCAPITIIFILTPSTLVLLSCCFYF